MRLVLEVVLEEVIKGIRERFIAWLEGRYRVRLEFKVEIGYCRG